MPFAWAALAGEHNYFPYTRMMPMHIDNARWATCVYPHISHAIHTPPRLLMLTPSAPAAARPTAPTASTFWWPSASKRKPSRTWAHPAGRMHAKCDCGWLAGGKRLWVG
jgi:hypothetical protein